MVRIYELYSTHSSNNDCIISVCTLLPSEKYFDIEKGKIADLTNYNSNDILTQAFGDMNIIAGHSCKDFLDMLHEKIPSDIKIQCMYKNNIYIYFHQGN